MDGETAIVQGLRRLPVLALVSMLLCALCMLAAAQARAAEAGLLPNIVADSPTNVSLETSTTEGGLKASGEPKLLLRFNGYIHNVGPGALDFRGSRSSPAEPMKPFQRVYTAGGSFKEEPSSAELIYVTADGHEHWHLQRAAKYSLWNASKTAEVTPAMKVGFCLDDSEHVESSVGPKEAVYSDATGREFCRQHQPEATSLFEGVSAGWRDLYSSNLAFQWVEASNVLPGEYWLREDVNPTGVIKEAGGANTPAYATSPTFIPGFDALAETAGVTTGQAKSLPLTSKAWNDSATPKYTIESQPSHGTLGTVSNGHVTYTPSAGYAGADSFTYSASDPNSPFPTHPSIATVAIEVGEGSTQPTPELLAGDATSTYPVGDQTAGGREEAFQFTAKSSGTVEELQFRTNATANGGVTGLSLGVFAENAGKPGEVLGKATVSGQPATSSWIKASGLSVPVTSATKYWLVALPLGASSSFLHYNVAVGSGGTGNLESNATGLTALTPEPTWATFNQGPVGFQAIGTSGVTQPQPSVTIEGAPASMTAGTNVQLTANVSNDSPTVTWSTTAGSITTGGLFTAPAEVPAGGSATVTATSSKGAKAQRTIEITPVAPSKSLLAGDATSTYPVGDQTAGGREEAFQFTAKSSGTVEELQFRTNATANGGVTGLSLGVFAENAGKPGEVLGKATVSGQPATSSWIKASGLSVPVTSATKYWLVALPLGASSSFLHYNVAVGSGGTGNLESNATGLTALTPEPTWATFNQGPVGFQAIGTSGGTSQAIAAGASAQSVASVKPAAASAPRAATPSASADAPAQPQPQPQPSVMIEGAPSAVIAGTSVQLSALSTGDSKVVSWHVSAGSIGPNGLFTAPQHPPAGGSVLLTALGERGARDERTIAVSPALSPQPAPAAPLPPAWDRFSPGLSAPQSMRVGRTLVMTTTVSEAGRLSLVATLDGRRLGGCLTKTPAERSFTCRVKLAGGLRHAAIAVRATLDTGRRVLRQARAPGAIAPMKMPVATPLGGSGLAASSKFVCGPPTRLQPSPGKLD
jgi:cell division septation protein DedD